VLCVALLATIAFFKLRQRDESTPATVMPMTNLNNNNNNGGDHIYDTLNVGDGTHYARPPAATAAIDTHYARPSDAEVHDTYADFGDTTTL
jgi:hypothetical protein